MGTTTYSITWAALLALDRRVESPSTQTIATLATSEQTAVATDLNPKLGTGNTMGTYAQSTYVATQQSVSWTTAPSLGSVTTNTATIGLTSDNDYGEVACVALADGTYSNNQKPTVTQVFLGLDRNNAAAISSAKAAASTTSGTETTKTASLTLDNLTKGTQYQVFCTASNGFATFPGFITYASDDNYVAVVAKTSGEVEDADEADFALLASSNVVSLFLMIAALIFN